MGCLQPTDVCWRSVLLLNVMLEQELCVESSRRKVSNQCMCVHCFLDNVAIKGP